MIFLIRRSDLLWDSPLFRTLAMVLPNIPDQIRETRLR